MSRTSARVYIDGPEISEFYLRRMDRDPAYAKLLSAWLNYYADTQHLTGSPTYIKRASDQSMALTVTTTENTLKRNYVYDDKDPADVDAISADARDIAAEFDLIFSGFFKNLKPEMFDE